MYGSGYWSDVAAGLEWVANQGYDVGSMSLGGDTGSSTLRDACKYAYDNGVLLVAAAGNDGECTDCVLYPAKYSTVMAISSSNSNDGFSYFSSQGPEIELIAPGSSIYSTVIGGYGTYSGTSMACPHVSGAGGLLMANGYTNTEARDRLKRTAEDIGLSENRQGSGLLDAEAAVTGTSSLSVTADSPTNFTATSVTLNGSLDDLGGASSADVYFEWREAGASSYNKTSVATLSATGTFSETITGLSSGTDHEFRAVAAASDNDTDTGSLVGFTTGSGSGGDNAPAIDRYAVSEKGSPNPHAEITANWAVSDVDGDLASVVVEVKDSRGVVDSSRTNVSGDSATGSDSFKIKFAEGQVFDVVLTVTDKNGNKASSTKRVAE